jgi:murein DD-endopeptidase MepM/ murein hydrolase activator NlpD
MAGRARSTVNMRKNFHLCRIVLVLFVSLIVPGLAHAGLLLPPDRPLELVVRAEKSERAGPAAAKEAPEKGLFFNALETRNFEPGAVKSFVVKVARRPLRAKEVPSGVELPRDFVAAGPLGPFMRPVAGSISSYFGYRKHPYRRVSRTFHTGIDIPAPTGTPIRVVAPGKVVYSGWRSGYGLMVEVDHGNGISTVYAHCSKLFLRLGQVVSAGQLVGGVGRTGVTTGSHLHFEVRRRGSPVDPMRFLAR